MSCKNKIFTILLLLANILLLVHSAVPHIHHDGIICFVGKGEVPFDHECADYDSSRCIHVTTGHNEDAHKGNLEDCNLPTLLQRTEKTNGSNIAEAITNLSQTYTTLLAHTTCFCFSSQLLEVDIEQNPYLDNYISPLIGATASLRAPPVFLD